MYRVKRGVGDGMVWLVSLGNERNSCIEKKRKKKKIVIISDTDFTNGRKL